MEFTPEALEDFALIKWNRGMILTIIHRLINFPMLARSVIRTVEEFQAFPYDLSVRDHRPKALQFVLRRYQFNTIERKAKTKHTFQCTLNKRKAFIAVRQEGHNLLSSAVIFSHKPRQHHIDELSNSCQFSEQPSWKDSDEPGGRIDLHQTAERAIQLPSLRVPLQ